VGLPLIFPRLAQKGKWLIALFCMIRVKPDRESVQKWFLKNRVLNNTLFFVGTTMF
jgi:hypothetical protein